MTRDKVKEIIEDIFEGKWEENRLTDCSYKPDRLHKEDINTTILLLEELGHITRFIETLINKEGGAYKRLEIQLN